MELGVLSILFLMRFFFQRGDVKSNWRCFEKFCCKVRPLSITDGIICQNLGLFCKSKAQTMPSKPYRCQAVTKQSSAAIHKRFWRRHFENL